MSFAAITVISIAILVALFATVIISIFNGIIARMNAVSRAWADVITQERQKGKVLPTLQTIAAQYAAHEQSIQVKIAELSSAIRSLDPSSMDADALNKARSKTSELVTALNVIIPHYPTLRASETFMKLMAEISEQEDSVSAAIRIFNQNVEAFNNGIQEFPNSIVNAHFNKKSPVATFTDTQAKTGIEYSPSL